MASVWIKLVSSVGDLDGSSGGGTEAFNFELPSSADCDGRVVRGALLRRALASLPGYRQDSGGAGADYALKLRNARGALVPVGRSLAANTRKSPYTLELVRLDSVIGGSSATSSAPGQGQAAMTPTTQQPSPLEPQSSLPTSAVVDALQRRLSAIADRLSVLESCDPATRFDSQAQIDEELGHLKRRLEFLTQRSRASESADWEGMFRRNPMW